MTRHSRGHARVPALPWWRTHRLTTTPRARRVFGLSHGSERADLVAAAVIGVSLASRTASMLSAVARPAAIQSPCAAAAHGSTGGHVCSRARSTYRSCVARTAMPGGTEPAARLARAAVTPTRISRATHRKNLSNPTLRLREQVAATSRAVPAPVSGPSHTLQGTAFMSLFQTYPWRRMAARGRPIRSRSRPTIPIGS